MRYISTKAMRRLGVMAVGLLLLMVLLGTGMGYALWTHPMWLAALAGILVLLLAAVGVGNGACLLMAKQVKKM